ncbi:hypothetical protein H4R33_001778 [Dimargaris cristalligena]|nr:hypothetical protein H4R33_001778 [Dimargaris cristalligena]
MVGETSDGSSTTVQSPSLFIRQVERTKLPFTPDFTGDPPQRAQVTGIITSIHQTATYMSYTVDDGTGALPCISWIPAHLRNQPEHQPDFDLGQLVSVEGRLSDYKGTRQMTIQTIRRLEDPNEEIHHWLQVVYNHRTLAG